MCYPRSEEAREAGRAKTVITLAWIAERLPAQVWDLTAMRRELARRGIELPAEILSPTATGSAIEGKIEVVLDDGGLLLQLDGKPGKDGR